VLGVCAQAWAAGAAPAIAPNLAAADAGAPAAPTASAAKAPDAGTPAAKAQTKPASKAAPPPKLLTHDQIKALFDDALSEHFKGNHVDAAAGFYSYLRHTSKTDDRYEWAEHFLSLDLDALGFAQAALEYEVFVAEERARPEVLPDTLTHLESLIESNPYPRALVEDELLHGTDFGPLPVKQRGFVAYYQGLVDYRLGMTKWGDSRFQKVPKDSPYAAKVAYAKAVYALIHDRKDDQAKAQFTALAADTAAPQELRNRALMALARLAYEAKQYQKSYDLWGEVELPELDPGRANIYLERAWNLYRMKRDGEAMGLLYALEAPSFHGVFLPDKYLLRSLIYKDLCHYLPAKRSARAFSRFFATSLRTIKERGALDGDPKLMAAALQLDDADYGDAHRLHQAVQREQERIGQYASPWNDSGLTQELRRLYGLQAAETARHEIVARDAALRDTADKLLAEAEQLRLEDYEVGLAMYARLKRGQVVTEPAKTVTVTPDEVVYPFDGEYWNDELHDFRLFITSRCLEQEASK